MHVFCGKPCHQLLIVACRTLAGAGLDLIDDLMYENSVESFLGWLFDSPILVAILGLRLIVFLDTMPGVQNT